MSVLPTIPCLAVDACAEGRIYIVSISDLGYKRVRKNSNNIIRKTLLLYFGKSEIDLLFQANLSKFKIREIKGSKLKVISLIIQIYPRALYIMSSSIKKGK